MTRYAALLILLPLLAGCLESPEAKTRPAAPGAYSPAQAGLTPDQQREAAFNQGMAAIAAAREAPPPGQSAPGQLSQPSSSALTWTGPDGKIYNRGEPAAGSGWVRAEPLLRPGMRIYSASLRGMVYYFQVVTVDPSHVDEVSQEPFRGMLVLHPSGERDWKDVDNFRYPIYCRADDPALTSQPAAAAPYQAQAPPLPRAQNPNSCIVCGGPPAATVEVRGQTRSYCRAHLPGQEQAQYRQPSPEPTYPQMPSAYQPPMPEWPTASGGSSPGLSPSVGGYSGGGSDPGFSSVCGAPTQRGGSCQRRVRGGGRCYQHR